MVERPCDVEDDVGELLEHPLDIPGRGTLAWGIGIRRISKGPCIQGTGGEARGRRRKVGGSILLGKRGVQGSKIKAKSCVNRAVGIGAGFQKGIQN